MRAFTVRHYRCARAAIVLFTAIVASGCARRMSASNAIDTTLAICAKLSVDAVESVVQDEDVRFWFQTERANASRKMWNRGGIRALANRIAATPQGRDQVCLERALREARAKAVEHF